MWTITLIVRNTNITFSRSITCLVTHVTVYGAMARGEYESLSDFGVFNNNNFLLYSTLNCDSNFSSQTRLFESCQMPELF